jgi:hypothetical protein
VVIITISTNWMCNWLRGKRNRKKLKQDGTWKLYLTHLHNHAWKPGGVCGCCSLLEVSVTLHFSTMMRGRNFWGSFLFQSQLAPALDPFCGREHEAVYSTLNSTKDYVLSSYIKTKMCLSIIAPTKSILLPDAWPTPNSSSPRVR